MPPREAFLGEAEQVAVDDAVGRISCESIASLSARRAGAAAGRAHLGRDGGLPARAGGQRRAPARRQRPGVPDHQRAAWRARDRPLGALGQVRREARLRGAADVRAARRTRRIPPSSRASTWRSSARRWTTSCPTARAPASPRARSARRAAPPGPHLEVKVDALRRAAGRRLRRRPDHPRRRRRLPRRDRGDRRRRSWRPASLPGRARRRPLDHQAVRARGRGRARPGRHDPLRHPHRHRRARSSASSARTAPSSAGWSTTGSSTAAATPRSGCAATGPARPSSRWQAEHGIT